MKSKQQPSSSSENSEQQQRAAIAKLMPFLSLPLSRFRRQQAAARRDHDEPSNQARPMMPANNNTSSGEARIFGISYKTNLFRSARVCANRWTSLVMVLNLKLKFEELP